MNACDCLVFFSHEIIKTTPLGELDLDATKQRLWKMTTPDEPMVCEVLFDLREPPCPLSRSALRELVRELGRIDHLFTGKIALLYAAADQDPTVATSPDGRYQTAYFTDFDEAMHWLTA